MKKNQATSEEQTQHLATYLSQCKVVKMDINNLQLKMELPSTGEWTLANEKKIPLISITDTFYDSLQKQWQTGTDMETKAENENKAVSVKVYLPQMRLWVAIQDFIESAGLTFAHFSFFNTDWEMEKEVTFGEEVIEVAVEEGIAA